MRRKHWLRENQNNETIHNAIWFDTETDQVVDDFGRSRHILKHVMACYSRRLPDASWSTPDFLATELLGSLYGWIEEHTRDRTKTYLFCHNTNYDLPVIDIFHELGNRGWKLKTAIIDAPPTILMFKKGTRTIEVLDTLNIWRMPLKKVGEIVGLPKLTMPSKTASEKDWLKYERRDVEIIWKAVTSWCNYLIDQDMGGFAPTLASQALRTYRHKYMMHRILIDDDDRALQLSRRAYYGGRVEAYRLGKIIGNIHVLDVNSLYPYVMRENVYPTVLIGYTARASVSDLVTWLQHALVVADVTIKTDVAAYPLRYRGKLIFPVGTFRTVISTPEIAYALERGDVVKVHAAAIYEYADLFSEFVNDMYDSRLDAATRGDINGAHNFKILMNSLYGKFGQRGIVYDKFEEIDDLTSMSWIEYDAETGQSIKWRQLGGLRQRQKDESESRDSHPAIAAHVAAYARMYLFNLIERAGHENVYYVDTDSLFVNGVGNSRLGDLVSDNLLGYLKTVTLADEMTIRGLKDYDIGDIHKHKGIRVKAIEAGPNLYVQQKWSSLRGLLREGDLRAPTTEYIVKYLSGEYTKGNVGPGGTIRPYRFRPVGQEFERVEPEV